MANEKNDNEDMFLPPTLHSGARPYGMLPQREGAQSYEVQAERGKANTNPTILRRYAASLQVRADASPNRLAGKQVNVKVLITLEAGRAESGGDPNANKERESGYGDIGQNEHEKPRAIVDRIEVITEVEE